MATLTGLIPVTVDTFQAYQGGGWQGGYHWGGGGAGNAERRTIYRGYFGIMEKETETTILYRDYIWHVLQHDGFWGSHLFQCSLLGTFQE